MCIKPREINEEVLSILIENDIHLTAAVIAENTQFEYSDVKTALERLTEEGLARGDGDGFYRAAGAEPPTDQGRGSSTSS